MYSKTYKRPNATFITNGSGFAELMNNSAVQAMISQEVNSRASALTGGEKTYRAEVVPGVNRCHGYVATDSFEARLSNSRNNDLLKVLK